ncbi:hypothetical protein N9T48_00135 [bacterium]|nr:hypothetical protein [bacterium]
MDYSNYKFKGNFGTLELVVDDNGIASGTYQKGGTLSWIKFNLFMSEIFFFNCETI